MLKLMKRLRNMAKFETDLITIRTPNTSLVFILKVSIKAHLSTI